MIAAARVGGTWHHSRAHRFFANARWNLDQVGLTMFGLVVGWLTPTGAPGDRHDDTLFWRSGRHVHAAFWACDSDSVSELTGVDAFAAVA
jgi:hypothetical protein